MSDIPKSYRELDDSASLLFLNLPFEVAADVVDVGLIPVLDDLLKVPGGTLGVSRHNVARAARRLPPPWAAAIGEFVQFDLTPCTRGTFAAITGQSGAVRLEREDVVSFCVEHDHLRCLKQPIVYADALCTRDEVVFSGDRDLLREAAWNRIRNRDFRPDASCIDALHGYDASALVWGAVPTEVVRMVICRSEAAAERLRHRFPSKNLPVMARAGLFW